MFSISNNGIITLTRGDNIKVPLFINAGDETDMARYSLKDYDTLYVGIMTPGAPFENSLIRKVYTKEDNNIYGDIVVELGLNDTQYLMPGLYYFEAKLKIQKDEMDKGKVCTVVPRRKFFIVE